MTASRRASGFAGNSPEELQKQIAELARDVDDRLSQLESDMSSGLQLDSKGGLYAGSLVLGHGFSPSSDSNSPMFGCKYWGRVTSGASPIIRAGKGPFGEDPGFSLTIDSDEYRITLRHAMKNTHYCVVATYGGATTSAFFFAVTVPISESVFDIAVYDTSGTKQTLSSVTLTTNFLVFGDLA